MRPEAPEFRPDHTDADEPQPSKAWREVDELTEPYVRVDLPSPSQAPAAPSIPPLPLELEPPEDFKAEWDGQSLPPCSAHKAWNVMMDAAGRERWANRNNPEPVARETHPSRVRPLEDNVLLYLKPRPSRMAGGLLTLPQNRAGRLTGAREAIVLATGPGWRLRGGRGPLVPTEVEPGQCVVVDAKAGQDWALDVGKPRTNPKGCTWASFPVPTELERVGGEYRMVRADEILFELPDQRPEDEALELDYGESGGRGTQAKGGWGRR